MRAAGLVAVDVPAAPKPVDGAPARGDPGSAGALGVS
jgi:hypothetical protein